MSDAPAAGLTTPVSTMPDSVTIIIFGGAGDLAHRKLLPALYNLCVDGVLPARTAIVGSGRKEFTDDQYRAFAKDGIERFSRRPIDAVAWTTFAEMLAFVNLSLDDPTGMATLGSKLDLIEHTRGLAGNRLYYLAVPPSLFVPTVEQLARAVATTFKQLVHIPPAARLCASHNRLRGCRFRFCVVDQAIDKSVNTACGALPSCDHANAEHAERYKCN